MTFRKDGFLLPAVAVLLAAAALLVGDALRGAALDQALVGAARDRQRGFEAAEIGLVQAQLAVEGDLPAEALRLVPVDAVSRARVTTDLVAVDSLPAGFSTDRVVAQRLRARSDGETDRGAHVALELGLTRFQPVP